MSVITAETSRWCHRTIAEGVFPPLGSKARQFAPDTVVTLQQNFVHSSKQNKRKLLRFQRNFFAVTCRTLAHDKALSFSGSMCVSGGRSRCARPSWSSIARWLGSEGGLFFQQKENFKMITGAQCRAARALVEWTRDILASNSNVDSLVIEEFEHKINTPDDHVRSTLHTTKRRPPAAAGAGAAVIRLPWRSTSNCAPMTGFHRRTSMYRSPQRSAGDRRRQSRRRPSV